MTKDRKGEGGRFCGNVGAEFDHLWPGDGPEWTSHQLLAEGGLVQNAQLPTEGGQFMRNAKQIRNDAEMSASSAWTGHQSGWALTRPNQDGSGEIEIGPNLIWVVSAKVGPVRPSVDWSRRNLSGLGPAFSW